tara:strand:- start:486 stop:809 length:324 start_codon:yes stop_codon:yes gene_type:complete
MWFWIVSSIAGSILGSATDAWFRDTKLGIWFYNKIDSIYTWASNRYGLKLLTDEQEQMKKFPQLEKRLCAIEKQLQELGKNETYNYPTNFSSFISGMSDNTESGSRE